MIKVLIFCAVLAFASSSSVSWIGSFTVTSTNVVGSNSLQCDLPPVGSTITITPIVGGMSLTKTSLTQGSITEILTWPQNQNVGVTCFSNSYVCVSGDLDPSTGYATLYSYYSYAKSVGCQTIMTADVGTSDASDSTPVDW